MITTDVPKKGKYESWEHYANRLLVCVHSLDAELFYYRQAVSHLERVQSDVGNALNYMKHNTVETDAPMQGDEEPTTDN